MKKNIVYDLMLDLMKRSDVFDKAIRDYFVNHENEKQKEEAKDIIYSEINKEIENALNSMEYRFKTFLELILDKVK